MRLLTEHNKDDRRWGEQGNMLAYYMLKYRMECTLQVHSLVDISTTNDDRVML